MTKQGFPCLCLCTSGQHFPSSLCTEEDSNVIHFVPVPYTAAGDTERDWNTNQNELWAYELVFTILKYVTPLITWTFIHSLAYRLSF